MKRRLTLFVGCLLFFLFGEFSSAQTVLHPDWVKMDSVGTSGTSEAWGIDIDKNGRVFWALSNNAAAQGLDINLYSFDLTGKPLWSSPFVFGGAGTQHAYVCNASDTAVYIGGRFCTGIVTSCDMLLLKVDKSTGKLIWNKTKNFAANGYDEVDGLEIKHDGIYCGGWAQELKSNIYRSDIGLWKLDFEGNTEWTSSLGTDNNAEHQDGHFVVDDSNIYAAGLWNGSGIANLYNGHSFLGKFEKSNGSLKDSTLFGYYSKVPNDIENALGMTTDGNYLYITGYSTPVNSNDWQIFVAKFDKDLNQIWFTDWGGSGSESARGIKVHNGIIYVAGLTESASLMSGGERDAVLLRLDTNGNFIDYQTFGGTDKESFQDLAVSGSRVLLTGTSESSSAKKSILLAVTDSTQNSALQVIKKGNPFTIYPNPSKGVITIQFNEPLHEAGKLEIFTLNGQQVLNQTFTESSETLLTLNLQPGCYFVRLNFSKYSVTRKIIVEH